MGKIILKTFFGLLGALAAYVFVGAVFIIGFAVLLSVIPR